MDRLVLEKVEIKTETKVEETSSALPEQLVDSLPNSKSYVETFEGKTLGDLKKEKAAKELEEFKLQKEQLIEDQFLSANQDSVEEKQESQNIIEKPNYDLIEEKSKTIKISRKSKTKAAFNKKKAGIALACALGAAAIVCVTNSVIIDNMSSSYSQINETYNINLADYIKNINKLDATKKSLGLLETYPEEELEAGEVGKKTNWFDRLCNFISGLFGG